MLRSGNDCAETLAASLSGSIENFTLLMNEKAKSLGANNSNFDNPHGLPDKTSYSTAKDLAKITAYALKNETFREIVSTKKHTATEINSGVKTVWKNKNKNSNS